MIMARDQPQGLSRIYGHAWIVKSGRERYIFTGTLSEFKFFKEQLPYMNPGAKTTYRKVN